MAGCPLSLVAPVLSLLKAGGNREALRDLINENLMAALKHNMPHFVSLYLDFGAEARQVRSGLMASHIPLPFPQNRTAANPTDKTGYPVPMPTWL
jgi:hypothetical protein